MIHLSVAFPSLLPIAIAMLVIWLSLIAFTVFIHLRTGNLRDLKYMVPLVEALVPRRRKKKPKLDR